LSRTRKDRLRRDARRASAKSCPRAHPASLIRLSDYRAHDDGQRIGRIRFASERSPGVWLWHVQVHIPGPPFGSAASLDEAKQDFRAAWLAFRAKHGPDALAKAYRAMNLREER
jgi:hypothetical protein